MGKSAVTEFFLQYFKANKINTQEVSENTGIEISKISDNYRIPLTAEEFLILCVYLQIKPETVRDEINRK